MALNVLGTELKHCCMDSPVTGFYRNGKCETGRDDVGMHTVCVIMTDDFLEFARDQGNDLMTPAPQYNFPGLVAGNRWCVCVSTVVDAINSRIDFRISLEGTHVSVKEFIDMDDLQRYSETPIV